MRQFYLSYPELLAEGGIFHAAGGKSPEAVILQAVRGESAAWQPGRLNSNLSWTHYRTLLKVSRLEARAFYEGRDCAEQLVGTGLHGAEAVQLYGDRQ